MNKLLVGVAAVGLMLSVSAMAQDTSNDAQKSDAPRSTTTQSAPDRQHSDSGRIQNDSGKSGDSIKGTARERSGSREEGHERSDVSVREGRDRDRHRTTVGVRVHDRHYREGYRTEVRLGHEHCRNVIVRERHHHHVVVRHIRRCF